jgi:hypothetical protein
LAQPGGYPLDQPHELTQRDGVLRCFIDSHRVGRAPSAFGQQPRQGLVPPRRPLRSNALRRQPVQLQSLPRRSPIHAPQGTPGRTAALPVNGQGRVPTSARSSRGLARLSRRVPTARVRQHRGTCRDQWSDPQASRAAARGGSRRGCRWVSGGRPCPQKKDLAARGASGVRGGRTGWRRARPGWWWPSRADRLRSRASWPPCGAGAAPAGRARPRGR